MAVKQRDESTLNIEQFLRGEGFDTAAAMREARRVLVESGLINPRKTGFAAYKVADARTALAAKLVRVCGDACAGLADADRRMRRQSVVSSGATCEVCGGSNNRRAAIALGRVLKKRKVRRMLIVGGTPTLFRELADLLPGTEIDFVDGTDRSHTKKDAIARMNRANVMVIWGSTPLRHAVSNHYSDERPPDLRHITVARRSIEALCDEVRRSYES